MWESVACVHTVILSGPTRFYAQVLYRHSLVLHKYKTHLIYTSPINFANFTSYCESVKFYLSLAVTTGCNNNSIKDSYMNS